MSKRLTTRWYIGAWVVWLVAVIASIVMLRGAQGGSAPPGVGVAYFVIAAAGIVMLVMWIGALVKLGTQRAWGWFVGVLVLQLIGLGIIGMIAYAVAGPGDTEPAVMRPTTT
jgi:hypothetical protein